MRRRPDLIVPIRDRRRRKRILTLRNFRNFVLGVAIVFAAVTIQSDLRRSPSGDYGRLLRKQVSGETISAKRVDVIREAPVIDETSADPLLVAPAAREAYLGVGNTAQTASASQPAQSFDAPRGKGMAIVGGPGGVTIVRGETPPRPTLSGGIFREH